MGRVRRPLHRIVWMATVGLVMAGSGCASPAATGSSSPRGSASATATVTLAATPSPHPIVAFTCSAGSLPVRPADTQTSCSVSTERGVPVLRATYTASGGSTPSVDEYALTTAGWKIATAAHGDGGVTSQGYGVYVYESAYFAFTWVAHSDGSFILTVQTSVPSADAPIACGQVPTAGSAQLQGIVLPSDSVLLLDGSMALAPACAADVQSFYATLLPAAGWHEDQPFISNPNQDALTTQVKQAVFTRGTVRAFIITAGYPGTQTLILPATTP